MKHLVDKTILVPFREELKHAVCIVSGRRSPAFRQGKHRARLYVGRSSGRQPGPTLGGLKAERQREEKTAHVWPYEPLCALFRQRAAAMHPRRSGPRFGNLRRPKEKAGERTGAFVAPVRSQLPAVRAVPEDGSRRFFGGDVICLTLIFGKEPEKPAVAGFIVTLVPDFSRLTGFERLRNCVA